MHTLNISKSGDSFTVSNRFVDCFMCDANGSFVKVYLYCLRYAAESKALSIAKIASILNMIQSDVISALKYWDSVGVLKFEKNDKNDYSVHIFESLDENRQQVQLASTDEAKPLQKKEVSGQISYSKSDLMTAMQGNEKVRQLFTISAQLLNKSLNTNDMNIIYMFYDYLKFSPEVIFSLIEYCVSIEKSNMRYIEKVALSWADAEINTQAKASAFIRNKNKEKDFLQKYKTMFKIVGRDFTESEVALLKSWVNEYKLTDEQILKAYEVTVMNTGKVAFKYMDSVIKNTLSQNGTSTVSKTVSQKKNSFQNYNSDDYQYEIATIKKNMNSDK